MVPASSLPERGPRPPPAGTIAWLASARVLSRLSALRRRYPAAPLALACWLLFCALLAAAGEWHVARIADAVLDDIATRAEAGAEGVERYLGRTLGGVEIMLDLTHTLAHSQEGDPRARALLDEAAAGFAQSRRLGVIDAAYLDADGRMIWTTAPDRMAANLRGRGIIRAIMQGQSGLQIGVPSPGATPGSYVLHIARADHDAEGRLIGIEVVAIDPAPQMAMVATIARLIRIGYAAAALGIGAMLLVLLVLRARQQGERELDAARAVEAEKDRLLGAVPAIVINGVIGADGSYHKRYISPSVEVVTGWPASALADDDRWTSLCDPASMPGWFTDRRASLHADAQTAEFRMRRPDGSWMWVREHSRVIRRDPDGGGEVVGYIVDISHERELAARAAGAAKLASLGEMATSLAHELNQPIAVMVAAADNVLAELEEGPIAPSDVVIQRLARIGEQGHRASIIIDHLRQFGRPGTEQTVAVDLAEVIEDARILAGGGLREAGVALEISIPDELPRVQAQRMPLEQVMVNLLANARDALVKLDHGVPRRLRIAARELGERVVVEVADNGGGIAPEVMARIFQPFVTTKGIATQGTAQGTGLGLAESYGILKSFGGSIFAANAEGGAVFTITLRCWAEEPALGRDQARLSGMGS